VKKVIFLFLITSIVIMSSAPADAAHVVYALGTNGVLLHLTDSGWEPYPTGVEWKPPALDYVDIWGSDPDNIYLLHPRHLYRYVGSVWHEVELPVLEDRYMINIDGTSANNIAITAREDSIFNVGDDSYLFTFDGSPWILSPRTNNMIQESICATPSETYYVAGHAWTGTGWQSALCSFDGSWTLLQYMDMTMTNNGIGPSYVHEWYDFLRFGHVVCALGRGYDAVDPGNTYIMHNTDSEWQYYHTTEGNLFGGTGYRCLWGSAENDIWIAGEDGYFCHLVDSNLTVTQPVTEDIKDLWGDAADYIFAVGTNGTILHYDGVDWTEMESGTTETLFRVWGSWAITTDAGETALPAAPAIESIHPNPFNPATTIVFNADGQTPVRLEVFDVAGRLVRVLVDEMLHEGRHEAAWNGMDGRGIQVSSGTYFCRYTNGDITSSRKMVLLR
jgi:hypothetical protein